MTGAYSYQIGTSVVPPDVTGFSAVQSENNVIMRWTDVDDQSVVGYDISFSKSTDGFDKALPLTEATRATELTTSNIPPGDWKVWIVAKNLAGDTSTNPQYSNLSVVNQNTVVGTLSLVPLYSDQNPDASWSFVTNLMVRHWTGKLIPKGSEVCSVYTPKTPPVIGDFALDYVPGGTFDDTTYYFQFTFVTQSGETLATAEASIFVPAGNLPTAFYDPIAYGSAFWNVYCATSSGAETLQNTDPLGQQGNVQVWQMPITGLVSGSALPTQDTTGWDVFNLFVPDCVLQNYFIPSVSLDAGSAGKRRAWITIDLVPGPGEPALDQRDWVQTFNILESASLPVTDISVWHNSIIATVALQYVQPYIILQSEQTLDTVRNNGSVCYINSMTITVDQ